MSTGIDRRFFSATLLFAATLVGQEELRPEGVSAEIHRSIQKGLQYLERTQNADGSWRSAGNYGSYPTAMTALAGMALLGSGSTPMF